MWKWLTFFLFITACLRSSAQEYYFDLSGYDFKMPENNFKIDSIIDVREDTGCIGYVCKGLQEKQIAAYLRRPLISYMNDYLFTNVNPNNNSEHLIIRINKLIIYELVSSSGQTAVAEMNLSFIVKKGEKYFEKFQAGTTIEKGSSMNVTGFHGKNIISALEVCFNQYVERDVIDKKSKKFNLLETDLQVNPLKNINYRIENIHHYTKGLYYSFFDFRDYTPDTLWNFKVEYVGDKNNPNYAIVKTQGNDLINKAWGFSDGNQNYFRIGDVYYPIEKEGKDFSLNKYPAGFGPVMILGTPDIISGLILTAALTGISAATATKPTYTINLTTGRFYPSNSSGDLKIESSIVVLSSRYNKPGKDMVLFVNGEKYCTLIKGSFAVLRFKSDVKNVDVCLEMNGEKVCVTSQPKLFNTDLFLVVAKGDKINIDKPNREKKTELISKIREGSFIRIEK